MAAQRSMSRAERRRAARQEARRPARSPRGGRKLLLLTGAVLLAVLALTLVPGLLGGGGGDRPPQAFELVATWPHDPQAFTQGLLWHDGLLIEGTGRRGHSELRRVALESGKVVERRALPSELFGEGVTVLGERVVQLTWQAGFGLVWDLRTFEELRRFPIQGEGWGLTTDGRRLIMSDGSATLRFLDPETFEWKDRLKVTSGGKPLQGLNELEFVKGEILANVFGRDLIARIDPRTGVVNALVDCSDLRRRAGVSEDSMVLNGIAYDAAGDRLFVTGKLWPKLFEIRLRGG